MLLYRPIHGRLLPEQPEQGVLRLYCAHRVASVLAPEFQRQHHVISLPGFHRSEGKHRYFPVLLACQERHRPQQSADRWS